MVPRKHVFELEQQMIGDIHTSHEAMNNLLVLCDNFGPRFAGTLEEHKSAEFIADTLVRYGLKNIHLEQFDFEGWARGPATLEIIEPVTRYIDCISLPYCPSGEVEGELVNLGAGTPQDYEQAADHLKGNFAMVSNHSPQHCGRYIHRMEKYHRAVLGGVCGFIWANERPAVGPETGCLTSPAPIPGIAVSHEDGEFLNRLLQRYGLVRLRLRATDVNVPCTSYNVVAELPGTDSPDTVVMLGCHYDSHDISPGAADSASGMAVVMEIARVLVRYMAKRLKTTVRFVAFAGEEMGMVGSKQYVNQHENELDNIRLFLNFDSAGAIDSRKGVLLQLWPELEPFFRKLGAEVDFSVGCLPFSCSDVLPFFLRGVPTASLSQATRPTGRGFGHTSYDTVDKLSIASLRIASAIGARVALHIASVEEFPARRRNYETVQQIVKTAPAFEGYRLMDTLG